MITSQLEELEAEAAAAKLEQTADGDGTVVTGDGGNGTLFAEPPSGLNGNGVGGRGNGAIDGQQQGDVIHV